MLKVTRYSFGPYQSRDPRHINVDFGSFSATIFYKLGLTYLDLIYIKIIGVMYPLHPCNTMRIMYRLEVEMTC